MACPDLPGKVPLDPCSECSGQEGTLTKKELIDFHELCKNPTTPPPPGPDNYDRVRFVGTFTTTNTGWSHLQRTNTDPIKEERYDFKSDWYYPQPEKEGSVHGPDEEPFLTLGGAWFTYCTTPVVTRGVILDDKWDEINDYNTILDGTSWVNYPTITTSCSKYDGPYIGNPKLFGVKWRSISRLRCNGFFHSYSQSIGFAGICGNKMSKGVDDINGFCPINGGKYVWLDSRDYDFYAYMNGGLGIQYDKVESKIDGYWEFEKDGVRETWLGTDELGNPR
jgi:hypothetical protein